jgi:hypothetical protein
LAASLAVRANCLDALDRNADALGSNREAIATLSPEFLVHRLAFSDWMVTMCRQYAERCQRLGQAPDMELLGPIVAILQEQQGEAEEKQE